MLYMLDEIPKQHIFRILFYMLYDILFMIFDLHLGNVILVCAILCKCLSICVLVEKTGNYGFYVLD
jgi:hypothetical protein